VVTGEAIAVVATAGFGAGGAGGAPAQAKDPRESRTPSTWRATQGLRAKLRQTPGRPWGSAAGAGFSSWPGTWIVEVLMRAISFSSVLALVVASVACGGKTSEDGGSLDGGGTDTGGRTDSYLDTEMRPDEGVDSGVDYTLCTGPGTCVAVPRTCCGSCGVATPADVIGVADTSSSAYRTAACGPGSGCPACFRPEDPFLQAFCRANHCVAVNLRTDPMTACATDDDCQLRYEGCCEKCGAPVEGLFALRKDAVTSYRAEVCAPDIGCPKCAVGYPAGARAVCDATKHCAVTGLPLPD
jgi:hypothetical protein